ncbi:hypothetical protein [Diaphorobacter ruginosibacter]|uniref:hypothetical protein n=1 Tax=Diaphorobacter ruginosibacter TaxID=1715720 RepID=UPI00333F5964
MNTQHTTPPNALARHITFHRSTRTWLSESIEAAINWQTKRLHNSTLELSWRDGMLHIRFKATEVTVRGPVELMRNRRPMPRNMR